MELENHNQKDEIIKLKVKRSTIRKRHNSKPNSEKLPTIVSQSKRPPVARSRKVTPETVRNNPENGTRSHIYRVVNNVDVATEIGANISYTDDFAANDGNDVSDVINDICISGFSLLSGVIDASGGSTSDTLISCVSDTRGIRSISLTNDANRASSSGVRGPNDASGNGNLLDASKSGVVNTDSNNSGITSISTVGNTGKANAISTVAIVGSGKNSSEGGTVGINKRNVSEISVGEMSCPTVRKIRVVRVSHTNGDRFKVILDNEVSGVVGDVGHSTNNSTAVTVNDATASKRSVTSTKKNITATKKNITATKKSVPATKNNVTAIKNNVTATKKSVPATKKSVPATKKNVPATKISVPATKNNVTTTKTNLTATNNNVTANATKNNGTFSKNSVNTTNNNITVTNKYITATKKLVTAIKNKSTCTDINNTRPIDSVSITSHVGNTVRYDATVSKVSVNAALTRIDRAVREATATATRIIPSIRLHGNTAAVNEFRNASGEDGQAGTSGVVGVGGGGVNESACYVSIAMHIVI